MPIKKIQRIIAPIVALLMVINTPLIAYAQAQRRPASSPAQIAPATATAATAAAPPPAPPAAPAAQSSSPQNNQAASSPTGSTAQADILTGFQADLFNGAAVAKYPLQTPPGRNGIGPNLALTYSSSQGNGWLGVGWDLQLGKIERSTKNGVPNYDNSDTFRWSSPIGSAELVNVGGNEYRAKIESQFQKFIFYGN